MKKIHLSIPMPCHENWDAMTPTEKGKFCTSCQKTVFDFTNMSDRQIAAFFKRPSSSVCGRVYNDQLNRDITMPKKRVPWFKYFFQFAWPAFILFLKSCGVKDSSQGKIKVQAKTSRHEPGAIATLGVMLPEITPVSDKIPNLQEDHFTKGELIGDVAIVTEEDTIKMAVDTLDEIQMERKPMDTVTVIAYPATTGKIVMGGLSAVCTIENIEVDNDSVKAKSVPSEINFKVYPNPVRTGSALAMAFENGKDFPEQVQLFSSSGQLVLSERSKTEKAASGTIQIPSNLAAGIYFLHFITKDKRSKTTKIIVTK